MSNPIVGPTVTRKPVSYRGALKSQDWNLFRDQVVHDITNLCQTANSLMASQESQTQVVNQNLLRLQGQLAALRNQEVYATKVAGINQTFFSKYFDFRTVYETYWDDRILSTSRAMLSTKYGEITLPMRSAQERFFNYSLATGGVLPAPSMSIAVTSQFSKDGVTKDYEYGGTVTSGDPENAFGGFTNRVWARRVEFPIDSSVVEVECEVIATVPKKAFSTANLLELSPFPVASVDVTYVGLSQDLGDSYTSLTATDLIAPLPTRFHFVNQQVEKIKIQLRQRNWVEENGRKVFYYGLEEVSLKLIDYNRSYTADASFGTNNTAVVKLDVPSGYAIDRLSRIDLTPDCLGDTTPVVHLALATSVEGTPAVIWDSDQDALPQNMLQSFPVSSATTLYAIFELQYSSGTETFPANTTPYVRGIGLTYSVVAA